MAKKGGARPETKSEFLRKILGKNPDLDYQQVNRRWAKAGHAGEISNALYYRVRAELGIRTEWIWVKVSEPTPGPTSPAGTGEVFQFTNRRIRDLERSEILRCRHLGPPLDLANAFEISIKCCTVIGSQFTLEFLCAIEHQVENTVRLFAD